MNGAIEAVSATGTSEYKTPPVTSAADRKDVGAGLDPVIDQPQGEIEVSEGLLLPRQPAEGQAAVEDEFPDTSYWDASGMAPLSATSVAALGRLRAYRPPAFPVWDRLPQTRRAAVLLLLYAGRQGELRVVVTMRAATLRNFSGHAALPGGKADSVDETPYQIARREAWEEIGLPLDEGGDDGGGEGRAARGGLPRPFRIEHLCDLPHNLAKTDLVVRPCVAFLHADAVAGMRRGKKAAESGSTGVDGVGGAGGTGAANAINGANNNGTMVPRLDAKEVAAVFSAPFHNFLRLADEQTEAPQPLSALSEGDSEVPLPRQDEDGPSSSATGTPKAKTKSQLPPGPWYEGYWSNVYDKQWRVHFFYVPVHAQFVAKPAAAVEQAKPTPSAATGLAVIDTAQEKADAVHSGGGPTRYKVWGLTAHLLVDAARVAYDETPEMPHNEWLGDEDLILQALKEGNLKLGLEGDEDEKKDGAGAAGKKRTAGTGEEGAKPGKKTAMTKV